MKYFHYIAPIAIVIVVFSAPIFWPVPKNIYKYGWRTRHVEIEQRVSEASIIKQTYYVNTTVYVKNLMDLYITSEESFFAVVTGNTIDATLTKQKKSAQEVKAKVEAILYR